MSFSLFPVTPILITITITYNNDQQDQGVSPFYYSHITGFPMLCVSARDQRIVSIVTLVSENALSENFRAICEDAILECGRSSLIFDIVSLLLI